MAFRLLTPRLAVAAVFFECGAMSGIWASRIPSITEAFGLDAGTLGLFLLAIAAGAILSFQLAGRVADQFGAAKTAFVLASLLPLTLLAVPLSPGRPALALALFILGACSGALDVAMNAWGAEVERTLRRPILSSLHALFSLGGGLGALTGFALAGALPVFTHFAVTALPIAAVCLRLAWIDWPSETRLQSGKPAAFALPRGSLFMIGVLAFCSAMGEGAVLDWSALFLVRIVETSEAQAALGFTVFSATMVTVRLAGDRAVARFGAVKIAQVSGLVACLGTLLVIWGVSLAAALLGMALIGIGYALIFPLAFSRAANNPEIPPGTAIASVATLGYGGLLLGPPIIGFIADLTSLRWGFAVLALLALLISALSRNLGERR